MTLLLYILSSIAGIVALICLIAIFVEKKYSVQSEIIINRPKQDVFNYIKFLKNQNHYSKWVMTDPNMKKSYTGTDGTVGFIYAWEGNPQAGKGEQEIKKIIEGEKLDIEVRFEKPMKAIGFTPFTTIATSTQQTKVIWGMSSEMKYPMNFMLLFLKGALRRDLDTSLVNLKKILEK